MPDKTLADLPRRLDPLARTSSPLSAPSPRKTRFGSPLFLSRVHWVEPQIVAEITYLTWTEDGLLRHTVYVGLRSDKPARCPKGNAAQRLRNWARLRPSTQRRRRGLSADCQAPVQNWRVCFVSAACCLLASAEATLRARPAAAFAALIHMLIGGFFFNQGFAICLFPSMGRALGLHSTSGA